MAFLHTLFLDDTGCVWCCGESKGGILGLGKIKTRYDISDTKVYIPRKIDFFIRNDIRIKDIKCGLYMSLAVGVNNKLYGWGWLTFKIDEPKEIEYFNDYIIDEIKCGCRHCYVKSVCGKQFLFGNNRDKECMVFDSNSRYVSEADPNQINDIVSDKLNCKIVDVFLGNLSTTLICQSLP